MRLFGPPLRVNFMAMPFSLDFKTGALAVAGPYCVAVCELHAIGAPEAELYRGGALEIERYLSGGLEGDFC